MLGKVLSNLLVPFVVSVLGFTVGYLPSAMVTKEKSEQTVVENQSKRCIVSKYKPTSFETSVKTTE